MSEGIFQQLCSFGLKLNLRFAGFSQACQAGRAHQTDESDTLLLCSPGQSHRPRHRHSRVPGVCGHSLQ